MSAMVGSSSDIRSCETLNSLPPGSLMCATRAISCPYVRVKDEDDHDDGDRNRQQDRQVVEYEQGDIHLHGVLRRAVMATF